ncbi:MAG TPA: Sua5/YciO/YrdC/YwlC family protein, partial [Chloroflexia bacterium]|nr:Sua5/YciO/YrdC/YwlC family protein [Chloroflexia bacterium]
GMAAATSANPSGMPDAVTAEDAYTYFGEAVALVIDGGRCVGATPSTVVDCTGELPLVLREGAISTVDIARAVSGPSSGF